MMYGLTKILGLNGFCITPTLSPRPNLITYETIVIIAKLL